MKLYRDFSTVEALDASYDTTRGVADVDAIVMRWRQESEALRTGSDARLGLRFGPHLDEYLDLFPAGPGAPVHLFVHGGYWRRFTAADFSFVAGALVEHGVTVAVTNYSLCPNVRLAEIVRQTRASVAWLHANVERFGGDPGRITISGHSAGAHLAAMALATDWCEEYGLAEEPIKGACLVSGLFDLGPFPYTWLQPSLQLSWDEVRRYSPLNHLPRRAPGLLITVGSEESAEFHRQSRAYLEAWRAAGHDGEWIELPGRHHFSALDALTEATNPLFRAVLAQAQVVGGR